MTKREAKKEIDNIIENALQQLWTVQFKSVKKAD